MTQAIDSKATLPTWCKTVFVLNIIWLALTSTMFIKMATGSWQETVRRMGSHPVIMESAVINACLVFVTILVGITANVLLLKLHPRGIWLSFITLGLAGHIQRHLPLGDPQGEEVDFQWSSPGQ